MLGARLSAPSTQSRAPSTQSPEPSIQSRASSTQSRVMLNSILCAIDFSEFSKQVLSYGAGFARRFDADLLICHTVCFPRDQLYGTVENKRSQAHERLARQAYQKIGKLMETAPIRWDPLITFEDPVDADYNAFWGGPCPCPCPRTRRRHVPRAGYARAPTSLLPSQCFCIPPRCQTPGRSV